MLKESKDKMKMSLEACCAHHSFCSGHNHFSDNK